MLYKNFITDLDNFVFENFDVLELLYPRESDCKYASIIKSVEEGKKFIEMKNEIEVFYRFQGMDTEKRGNLLKIFDNEKKKIKQMNMDNIDKIYELYCSLLDKTAIITSKNQYVNTSKLMNLCNQNIPLYDNNVINVINHFHYVIEKRTKRTYFHILNIYNLLDDPKNIPNIIELKNSIYGKTSINEINLLKFLDTLMYFINDTEKLLKYKLLCTRKGQTST